MTDDEKLMALARGLDSGRITRLPPDKPPTRKLSNIEQNLIAGLALTAVLSIFCGIIYLQTRPPKKKQIAESITITEESYTDNDFQRNYPTPEPITPQQKSVNWHKTGPPFKSHKATSKPHITPERQIPSIDGKGTVPAFTVQQPTPEP